MQQEVIDYGKERGYDEEQVEALDQVSKMTKLSLDQSRRLLETSGWNVDRAVDLFRQYLARKGGPIIAPQTLTPVSKSSTEPIRSSVSATPTLSTKSTSSSSAVGSATQNSQGVAAASRSELHIITSEMSSPTRSMTIVGGQVIDRRRLKETHTLDESKVLVLSRYRNLINVGKRPFRYYLKPNLSVYVHSCQQLKSTTSLHQIEVQVNGKPGPRTGWLEGAPDPYVRTTFEFDEFDPAKSWVRVIVWERHTIRDHRQVGNILLPLSELRSVDQDQLPPNFPMKLSWLKTTRCLDHDVYGAKMTCEFLMTEPSGQEAVSPTSSPKGALKMTEVGVQTVEEGGRTPLERGRSLEEQVRKPLLASAASFEESDEDDVFKNVATSPQNVNRTGRSIFVSADPNELALASLPTKASKGKKLRKSKSSRKSEILEVDDPFACEWGSSMLPTQQPSQADSNFSFWEAPSDVQPHYAQRQQPAFNFNNPHETIVAPRDAEQALQCGFFPQQGGEVSAPIVQSNPTGLLLQGQQLPVGFEQRPFVGYAQTELAGGFTQPALTRNGQLSYVETPNVHTQFAYQQALAQPQGPYSQQTSPQPLLQMAQNPHAVHQPHSLMSRGPLQIPQQHGACEPPQSAMTPAPPQVFQQGPLPSPQQVSHQIPQHLQPQISQQPQQPLQQTSPSQPPQQQQLMAQQKARQPQQATSLGFLQLQGPTPQMPEQHQQFSHQSKVQQPTHPIIQDHIMGQEAASTLHTVTNHVSQQPIQATYAIPSTTVAQQRPASSLLIQDLQNAGVIGAELQQQAVQSQVTHDAPGALTQPFEPPTQPSATQELASAEGSAATQEAQRSRESVAAPPPFPGSPRVDSIDTPSPQDDSATWGASPQWDNSPSPYWTVDQQSSAMPLKSDVSSSDSIDSSESSENWPPMPDGPATEIPQQPVVAPKPTTPVTRVFDVPERSSPVLAAPHHIDFTTEFRPVEDDEDLNRRHSVMPAHQTKARQVLTQHILPSEQSQSLPQQGQTSQPSQDEAVKDEPWANDFFADYNPWQNNKAAQLDQWSFQ